MNGCRMLLAALTAFVVVGCVENPTRPDASQYQQAATINLQLGMEYMQKGRFDLAEEKLLKAISIDDSMPEAHNALGVLYDEQGRPKRAEDEYRRALRLYGGFTTARLNLGALLCEEGRYDEGEEAFARVHESDEGDLSRASALEGIGLCRKAAGDVAGAKEKFNEALELNPTLGKALLEMASISLDEFEPSQARGFLQRYHNDSSATPRSLLLGYEIELDLGNEGLQESYGVRLRTEFPDSEEAAILRRRGS